MPNRSKAQILVVDDDAAIRTSLGTLLLSAGYDVATANDGLAAVAHFSNTVPDLLVTDLDMPTMSGVELISHVRWCHPSVLIIAMGSEYRGDAVPASLVADRFYPKEKHFEHFLATIASLIAANPASESAEDYRPRPALNS
jgi:CheY-like chemotaxis protein